MLKNLIILFTPRSGKDKLNGITLPYAMLHLERMIRDMYVRILFIDEQFQHDYESIISENSAHLLLAAVTASTGAQIKYAIRFSETVRKLAPHAHIVWGGWHASLLPEQTLNEAFIDSVVSGPGEIPFRELVSALLESRPLTGINMLFFKHKGQIIKPTSALSLNKNVLPPLDYSLIDCRRYVFKYTRYKRTINYFTGQGCPCNCGFCVVPAVYKGAVYAKDNTTIINDLLHFKTEAAIDSVFFWDENFFLNKPKALELCKMIIDNNLNVFWDVWAYAKHFVKNYSADDIRFMHKAGLRRIFIGAESGNEGVLHLINKNQTTAHLFSFVTLLKNTGVTPVFSMITYFPEQNDNEILDTLDMLRKAKLLNNNLMALFSDFTPYPGTALYSKALENGFIPPQNLSAWSNHCLSTYVSPWRRPKYRQRLMYFDRFYLLFANPHFYKLIAGSISVFVFFLNMALYPLVYMRFKYNYFKWPIEAAFFLGALTLLNQLAGTRFKAGNNRVELN